MAAGRVAGVVTLLIHIVANSVAIRGAGAVFFAAAFLTGALFAAFAGVLFAAFFAAAFFLAGAAFFAAAFAFATFAALAFLRFATSFAFAAAESFRFGFGGSGVGASTWVLDAAHLFRCASAIRARAAALIFRRLRVAGSGVTADSVGPPGSRAFSSTILMSMRAFCAS